MTPRHRPLLALGCACGLAAPALAGEDYVLFVDATGDAVLRRTDPGADGAIHPDAVLPDLMDVKISAWEMTGGVDDPYTGYITDKNSAHLFRLDARFKGLINPPGPLGIGGGQEYDPHRFGPSPLYGFIDIDIDDQKNTGGVIDASATNRYLANVARFGRLPYGSIGERAAQSLEDLTDGDFYSGPQFERTGAEFNVTLCGCFAVKVEKKLAGDGDDLFEAGETWIVSGRFFERVRGFVGASNAFGGSAFGHYDPVVWLRFSHDAVSDVTTVSLVYPLDMEGAAILWGGNVQGVNNNVGDHTSILEGMQDVINNAKGKSGPLGEITKGWIGRDAEDSLRVDDWHATALVGTAYLGEAEGALYAWTDTGFYETHADVDSDGIAGPMDESLFRSFVYANDGGGKDGDGAKNGRFKIKMFGLNFSLYDFNGDGYVDGDDLYAFGDRADLDKDGKRTIFDFLAFSNYFNTQHPIGDFNLDGQFTLFDFLAFLSAFQK